MMGMSACNRYSPSWEEDADGTKQEPLQSVLGIPDIIGTEIDNAALLRSVTDSYGMVSDENKDQSALLQKAIDDMAGQGGGNLLIPAGTYCFAEVYMKSGVHILVHKDAVLKPYWGEKTKNVIMLHFNAMEEAADSYICDCSISGLNGERYMVDFSALRPDNDINCSSTTDAQPVRFVMCRLVKNFIIADAEVMDNYTKFSALEFTGAKTENVEGWEVTRPTNGLIRNCRIVNADFGYGLSQLHGGQNLLFRDIDGVGGVTLRLETHSGNNIGVSDIYAYNVSARDAHAAVMFSPHLNHNGKVLIENVKTENTTFGVEIENGFLLNGEEGELGTFSSDSKVHNVTSVYGETGQIREQTVYLYEPEQYPLLQKVEIGEGSCQYTGPSVAAVFDASGDCYDITVTDVKAEGFVYHPDGVFYEETIDREVGDSWDIIKNIPAFQKE